MIKLKNLLHEGYTSLPKNFNPAKEAKLLYVKDKDGKYIITPKTLTNFFKEHPHQGVNPEIAKSFINKFDFYAFNQFASENPVSNIKDDYETIMSDYNELYRRW
jgi:hypothetical protein